MQQEQNWQENAKGIRKVIIFVYTIKIRNYTVKNYIMSLSGMLQAAWNEDYSFTHRTDFALSCNKR